MSYTVDWSPSADNELATIWLRASDRNAVTAAANAAELLLKRDPENEGESRPNDRRIMFSKPLALLFRVLTQEKQVIVLHVWQF